MSSRLDCFTVIGRPKAPDVTFDTLGTINRNLAKKQIQNDSSSPLRDCCPHPPTLRATLIPQKRKQNNEHRTIIDFFGASSNCKESKKNKLKAAAANDEESIYDVCTIRAPVPLNDLWIEITAELFLFPFYLNNPRVKSCAASGSKRVSDEGSDQDDIQTPVRRRMTAKESFILFSIIADEL